MAPLKKRGIILTLTYLKSYYKKLSRTSVKEKHLNTLILFFMVAVYPLVFSTGMTGFTLPKYLFLALVSTLALFLIIRHRTKLLHPAFIPLGLFIAFTAISAVLAHEPLTAWIGLYRYTGFSTYIFCVILFITATASNKPEKVLGYMVACAVLVSLIAVLQYLGINFILPHKAFSREHSVYATIGNPNFLATYTVFILPAAIMLYLRKLKPILLIAAAIIYAGLLVSLTRGAWLAFLPVNLILVYYCCNKKTFKSLGKLYIVFCVVTCFLLPVHDWFMLKCALTISDQVTAAVRLEDRGGSGRVQIWKETVKIIGRNWAFGVGPDSFRLRRSTHTVDDKAHNIYLEIAVTMGVFALISYLYFLSFFLRPWNNEPGFILFLMVFAYLVQGFFNIDVIAVMPLFWIVLGLSLANGKALKHREKYDVRLG